MTNPLDQMVAKKPGLLKFVTDKTVRAKPTAPLFDSVNIENLSSCDIELATLLLK
jgi:hypothetical protein